MDEIEKQKKKLKEMQSERKRKKWKKRINWINKYKSSLTYIIIFLMLGFIIFNQVTYVDTDQYFYIGEVEDIGIRWEGGYTKTAVLWVRFNDSNSIDFRKYSFDVYEKIDSGVNEYVGNRVIITYEKSILENTLLSIMIL